jgi:hypothetical protein
MTTINNMSRVRHVSVDEILSKVSHMNVQEQGKDGAQNHKTMTAQAHKSEKNRNETRTLETKARRLGAKLRKHNKEDSGWFDSFFGNAQEKSARLNGKIKHKASEIKEKQADLDVIKKRNQDELASMKNKLEASENVFSSLNESMKVQAQTNQNLSNNIKQ